jgi:NADH-quinone oxidoreductase subunit I
MAYVKVKRRELTLSERLYLPTIAKGLATTAKHLFKMGGTATVTMQYPEEKWRLPERYRGVPVLVKDQDGREKCVSCSLCEFVCPPRAISIIPQEIEGPVEKAPKAFDIDMLRCIFCGYCEEVCPEEAIFMSETYEVCGQSRDEMIFRKDKLYELGEQFGRDGRVKDAEKKYDRRVEEAAEQGIDHAK